MSGVLWSVVEDKLDLMEAYWVYLHSSNQGVRANSLASAVFGRQNRPGRDFLRPATLAVRCLCGRCLRAAGDFVERVCRFGEIRVRAANSRAALRT